MQYALINGKRKIAEPKLKAICGHCGSDVQSKCGSKVVWHWAHVAGESCDSWYEPETQWHRDWKEHFGMACSEISMVKENVKHIADVLTKDGLVIEFQNSPISSETIMARELFYEKMIWVINGQPFKENFQAWDKEYAENWELKMHVTPEFYHPGLQRKVRSLTVYGNQVKHPEIREVLTRLKFDHNPFTDVYYYDLTNLHNSHVLEAKVQAGILKLYNETKTERKLKPVIYTWTKPRKSWLDAKAPVFIDFNEDYLVLIKTNMGNRTGEGLKVSKKDFLAKYNQ